MQLKVYFGDKEGNVIGIVDSPILHTSDVIDPKTLLACERPCGFPGRSCPMERKRNHNGNCADCSLSDLSHVKINRKDYERLYLRINFTNKDFLDVKLESILKHSNGVTNSNFREELRSLRDLRRLPKAVSTPEVIKHKNEITEDVENFLNLVKHIELLNLGKDHERELYNELKLDKHFIVFKNWNELTRQLSPIIAAFLSLERRINPLNPYAIVLELEKEVSTHSAIPFLYNAAGGRMYIDGQVETAFETGSIYHQMSHEEFINQSPDLMCHSRDARNFYFETLPEERKRWLSYDPDSIFTENIQAILVSNNLVNGKALREQRFEMISELVRQIFLKGEDFLKWEFSPYFFMEEKNSGYMSINLPHISIHVNDIDNNGADGEPGEPGIRITYGKEVLRETHEVINSLYKQVFGTNRRWLDTKTGMHVRAKQLIKSKSRDERNNGFSLYAQSEKMGVFLTQSQLHNLRVLFGALYENFNIHEELRRPTKERFEVSESRLNNAEEEARILQAKLDLLMHEITVTANLHDLRIIQSIANRALHQMTSINISQQELIKRILSETSVSTSLSKKLDELEKENTNLTISSLELAASKLEQDIRQMCDPGYAYFDPNLSTAKLVFGKAGLSKRLEQIKEKIEDHDYGESATHISNMLLHLEEQLDNTERSSSIYIEDLPDKFKYIGETWLPKS